MSPHLQLLLLTQCVVLFLLPQRTSSFIGNDEICRIIVVAPFTDGSGKPQFSLSINPNEPFMTLGYSKMAGAVLAVDHFNNRNASIVPELGDLGDCNMTLDIVQVVDTFGGTLVDADRAVLEAGTCPKNYSSEETETETDGAQQDRPRASAVAGPGTQQATLDVGVVARFADMPVVTTFSQLIVQDTIPLQRTSAFPDTIETSRILVSYMLHQKRTNYVAVLTSLADLHLGLQRRTALEVLFDEQNIEYHISDYIHGHSDGDAAAASSSEADDSSWFAPEAAVTDQTIRAAINEIRNTGYRTIIIVMHPFAFHEELQSIADAVEEFGMNRGDHFFMFFDPITRVTTNENSNVTKLLRGACFPLPRSLEVDLAGSDGTLEKESNPLTDYWDTLSTPRLCEELTKLNPIPADSPAFTDCNSFSFNETKPEYGSAFMYDAVLSIGMGACNATKRPDGSVTGTAHHEGIRDVNFFGASGRVLYGRHLFKRGGTRIGESMDWVAVNMLADPPLFQFPHILKAVDNVTELRERPSVAADLKGWKPIQGVAYVYADGTMSPPQPLRDPGDHHYLPLGAQIAGLTLMSITMAIAFLIIVWIYVCRKHPIVAASQPSFLMIICLGTMVQAFAVFTISFDESDGWTDDQLSSMCMALPWLFSMGLAVVTSALFTKLRRIHKTLQFSRKQMTMAQISWPMAVLLFSVVVILTCWTLLDPLVWQRREVDGKSETVGACRNNDGSVPITAFLVPLAGVLVAALLLMAFFTYKARDIHEAYSESNWILILIIVETEILMVGTPVVLRLEIVDTVVYYVVYTLLLLSFPWSTLGFLFGPKLLAYHRSVKGVEPQRKRGQQLGVTVTGLEAPIPSAAAPTHVTREALSNSSLERDGAADQEEHTTLELQNNSAATGTTGMETEATTNGS